MEHLAAKELLVETKDETKRKRMLECWFWGILLLEGAVDGTFEIYCFILTYVVIIVFTPFLSMRDRLKHRITKLMNSNKWHWFVGYSLINTKMFMLYQKPLFNKQLYNLLFRIDSTLYVLHCHVSVWVRTHLQCSCKLLTRLFLRMQSEAADATCTAQNVKASVNGTMPDT